MTRLLNTLRLWRYDRIMLKRSSLLTIVLMGAISACGSSNLIGPDNSLEVGNATDSFQWQVSSLNNVSQTLTYVWETTGTRANVNQSAEILSGSATVRISDENGIEVYSRSLADNGTFSTETGATGRWTIVVELSGVDGALNFRVQAP
ncbi:MAG: hypothetical protein QNJ97_28355 [Myxococcota bacterium]|nr:hypothetical protein [Myxococcota bacterium]